MAKKWTYEEEGKYNKELRRLYIKENKTIGEIGRILGLHESTIFGRLKRLGIKSSPERKENYLRKRKNIALPKAYNDDIAEFFGIMLGDGGINRFQVNVHLGTKEMAYAQYIAGLYKKVFGVAAKICIRKTGYKDLYLGSVDAVKWLHKEGLVRNKVEAQVDVPRWIFSKDSYMKSFVKGFFDTDGSIYRLRFGIQLSFTNRSLPLLYSLQKMVKNIGYTPSRVAGYVFYVTRLGEVKKFFRDIRPANPKHQKRFRMFIEKLGR